MIDVSGIPIKGKAVTGSVVLTGSVVSGGSGNAAGQVASDKPVAVPVPVPDIMKLLADAISGYMSTAIDEGQVKAIVDGQIRATVASIAKRVTESMGDCPVVDLSGGVAAAGASAPVEYVPAIPSKPEYFAEPGWYSSLRYAVASEKGATLFGPRGCGKSTAVRAMANELGQATITLQCAANMQLDSLVGSWTAHNGSMRFIDGPLTLAVRHGLWLFAEEANVIHPGVWSSVNTLTDKTGEGLRLPTGEVIQQHENFRLILIYNEGYAGTREVNGALKDRLMPIYCGYLEEKAEVDLLQQLTGIDEARSQAIVAVAKMIRAASLRFDISPRSLVRWVGLVNHGMTWLEAYGKAIVDLAGPADTAGPQRNCLEEIARNTVGQWTDASSSSSSKGKKSKGGK